jgi:hypothetical protein
MKKKLQTINCWEFLHCERQLGGRKAEEFGVCPTALEEKLHGVHGGKNGGRACWLIEGTMCGGKVEGAFSQKYGTCEKCDFFRTVRNKERPALINSTLS